MPSTDTGNRTALIENSGFQEPHNIDRVVIQASKTAVETSSGEDFINQIVGHTQKNSGGPQVSAMLAGVHHRGR